MTADGQDLEVSRRLDASPETLWSLWTEPAQLTRWWWPARFETTYHIDPTVGGSFRFTTADLQDIGVLDLAGTFLEVEPPRLLVYTWRWESDLAHESRVSVDFLPDGDHTAVRVRHEGLAGEADRDNHVRGWNDCLDRLEALIQQPKQ